MPDELASIGPPARAAKWKNPYRALPRVRWAVQGTYALFLGLVGYEFWTFHAEAVSGGPISAVRPPAVEAFLPISALVGLKRFVATGRWDDIHPAGLAILLGVIAMSLVARKSFCSWMCPVGTLLARARVARREDALAEPPRADRAALARPAAPVAQVPAPRLLRVGRPREDADRGDRAFMRSPFNMAADAKMLLFFEDLSATGAVVIGASSLLSIVVKHSWCRYLCPYGALLGLASLLSPARRASRRHLQRLPCLHARLPLPDPRARSRLGVDRRVHGLHVVRRRMHLEDCLTTTRRGARGLSPWLVPTTGLGTFLAVWALARADRTLADRAAGGGAGAGLPDGPLPLSLNCRGSRLARRHSRLGPTRLQSQRGRGTLPRRGPDGDVPTRG